MRLNFAGVTDENIREGVRRIGRTMGGDTGLLGTLSATASSPAPASAPSEPAATSAAPSSPAPASAPSEPAATSAAPSSPAPANAPSPAGDAPEPLADVVALPRRDAPDPARPVRRRRDR